MVTPWVGVDVYFGVPGGRRGHDLAVQPMTARVRFATCSPAAASLTHDEHGNRADLGDLVADAAEQERPDLPAPA
jgi:hypothetical protein